MHVESHAIYKREEWPSGCSTNTISGYANKKAAGYRSVLRTSEAIEKILKHHSTCSERETERKSSLILFIGQKLSAGRVYARSSADNKSRDTDYSTVRVALNARHLIWLTILYHQCLFSLSSLTVCGHCCTTTIFHDLLIYVTTGANMDRKREDRQKLTIIKRGKKKNLEKSKLIVC